MKVAVPVQLTRTAHAVVNHGVRVVTLAPVQEGVLNGCHVAVDALAEVSTRMFPTQADEGGGVQQCLTHAEIQCRAVGSVDNLFALYFEKYIRIAARCWSCNRNVLCATQHSPRVTLTIATPGSSSQCVDEVATVGDMSALLRSITIRERDVAKIFTNDRCSSSLFLRHCKTTVELFVK